jgi:hypothetical protein
MPLLCLGVGFTASASYGILDNPSTGLDSPAFGRFEETTLRRELAQYLRQVVYYQDKDLESTCQILEKLVKFMDQHPDLIHPFSGFGLLLFEDYLATLYQLDRLEDYLREINRSITFCSDILADYDRRGVLNLPLEEDIELGIEERAEKEDGMELEDLTEPQLRKVVFQQLFKAYFSLLNEYLKQDSKVKDSIDPEQTVDDMLSALEREFGPSFKRLPLEGRNAEIGQLDVFDVLETVGSKFASNTSPNYSPELALKLLHPQTELLPSLLSLPSISPCLQIAALQQAATLVLDLACESAPEGLLTTPEQRQYLEEAKRIQQLVLDIDAGLDPAKRDRVCDTERIEGLIAMAKIAWRFGEMDAGDLELEKASQLANATGARLYKEAIRRIDKHPSKTAMKHWEPVTAEECRGLIGFDDTAENDKPRQSTTGKD